VVERVDGLAEAKSRRWCCRERVSDGVECFGDSWSGSSAVEALGGYLERSHVVCRNRSITFHSVEISTVACRPSS
jgi:hypothetical protein